LDDHTGRCKPVSFIGQELVLYESVLTTSGPRYESRLTLELGH
jgi:2'-5' RNA ligase